jgi:hypothetical protein
MAGDRGRPEPALDFEGFADIPDPAAGVAAQPDPAPEIAAPAEPSPTRTQRRRRIGAAIALALASILLIVMRVGVRRDMTARDVAIPFVLWLTVAAFAVMVAFRRRERGIAPSVGAVRIVGVAVPALFAAIAFAWSEPHQSWGTVGECVRFAAMLSAIPMTFAALLLRRSFLTAPASRGAAVGAVCGLLGAAAVHTHCDFAGTGHMVFGHGLPILGAALVGAALGALRGRV